MFGDDSFVIGVGTKEGVSSNFDLNIFCILAECFSVTGVILVSFISSYLKGNSFNYLGVEDS